MTDILSQKDKAMRASLRLLKSRPRTQKEIRDYLYTKGFTLQAIEPVMAELIQSKAIDDDAFLKAWICARIEQVYSKEFIKTELIKKGFNSDQIEKEFTRVHIASREPESLQSWIKNELNKKSDLRLNRNKIYQRLLSHGFDPEVAEHALSRALRHEKI